MAGSVRLIVSRNALHDLEEIESYSQSRWGHKIAFDYIADIERALKLISDNPGILIRKTDWSEQLLFYTVRQHILVFHQANTTLLLLTIRHGTMDLPARLVELTPTLLAEIAYLQKKLTE